MEDAKKSLRQLTQQQFQEEVARELGIDLNNTTIPRRDMRQMEENLHADGGEENSSEP